MDGQDDGAVARAGRKGPSGDREDVRTRVLHSRAMEERRDRGGKPVLRPSRLSEANRRVVTRGLAPRQQRASSIHEYGGAQVLRDEEIPRPEAADLKVA